MYLKRQYIKYLQINKLKRRLAKARHLVKKMKQKMKSC